jgi:uncharacterized protein YciI
MTHYFGTLIPPRTTFPGDITPDELALMRQHAAYWKSLLEPRISVAFGPVMDPKGAFGVCIFKAEDEAAARAIMLADPVVKAGIGFTFTLLPMGNAIYRE